MIRTLLFVLSGILVFSSCRDNFDETGPDIIIDNGPIEVEATTFSSQVRNERGIVVSGATISLYLENNLVEQRLTDHEGKFTLSNVFTIADGYRLVIEKAFHHQSFQLLDLSNPEFTSESLPIYSFESGFPPTQLSPFDLELLTVSGRILSEGESMGAFFIHVFSDTGEFLNYASPRIDGSFEIAVPQGTIFDLRVVDPCGGVIIEKLDQQLNWSTFLFEEYLNTESKLVSLVGSVKTCDGDVFYGEPLFLSLNDLNFDPIQLDQNGDFEIEMYDCFLGDVIEFSIFSGPFATVANIFIVPEDHLSIINLNEVLLCEDSFSEMEIVLNGSDSLSYYNVLAFGNTNQLMLIDINGAFTMELISDADNAYKVNYLFIVDSSGIISYESQGANNIDIDMQLEYSEDTWELVILEGEFSGNFLDGYTQNQVSIEGRFEVPLIN